MPTDRRRAAARRRAWGRGPIILRFEPLEGRQLLAASALPDLVPVAFDTQHNLDWGDSFHAKGSVRNQGNAPVTTGFHVNIYASATAALSANSLLLGQATIPAGLQPGQQVGFDQVVSLPPAPAGAPTSLYVEAVVDPEGYVPESNKQNNAGNGQGYDTSVVTITPHLASDLKGASLGVYPDQAQWGQTVQVSAQIQNDAPGDAPPTRARLVLTPLGITPGGVSDVTIGNISVPAVPANQTIAVTQSVTLPTAPPAALTGVSQFVLSVVQDADFVTNAVSPHMATRGLGFDMTQLAIGLPQSQTSFNVPRPDLTVTQVQAPSLPITFGQSFQVTTTIANQGHLDAGAFKVRYLLVGSNGALDNALFLGDATVSGLKTGSVQNVVQSLQIPSKLPQGMTLNSGAVARIAVVVDPENSLDDASPANNTAVSSVVTLQVVGTNGTTTVPTLPTTTGAGATTGTGGAKKTTTTGTAVTPPPAKSPHAATAKKKFGPKAPKHTLSHNLKVFPHRVSTYLIKYLKKV